MVFIGLKVGLGNGLCQSLIYPKKGR